jgi:predicted ArsR family transcriptional regulator
MVGCLVWWWRTGHSPRTLLQRFHPQVLVIYPAGWWSNRFRPELLGTTSRMGTDRGRPQLAAIALLADELRQRLYRFVAAQPGPVTRDQAAAALGISRKLAAFHLDKLTAAGLLEATAADPASRRPGPGRAPKAYQPAVAEVIVSIPERRYDLLGDLLVQAIVAEGPASSARLAAHQLARDRGQALGERVQAERRLGRLGPERALTVVGELLAACGYQPSRAPARLQLVLGNCPFQQLARRAPELVCGLNQQFLAGLLAGLRSRRVDAVFQPDAAADPARCCVLLQG